MEAEVARERAIIKQEQHKTVISVTDAYDERLVTNLKMEVEKAKETADNLEKQYLEAAEERDTALTELEEVKRKNAELEKKLEQAMSVRLFFLIVITITLFISLISYDTNIIIVLSILRITELIISATNFKCFIYFTNI